MCRRHGDTRLALFDTCVIIPPMKKKTSSKIILLDAGTLDYKDLSLSCFEKLGDFSKFNKTSPDQMAARLKSAEHVVTNKCVLDRSLLTQLKSLKSIHIAATGVNNVDLDAARSRGIAVTNVAGYSTDTVVQFTIAFILALANNLISYDRETKAGKWSGSPFFMWAGYPVTEVAGKTLAILGYGNIGKRVARAARALGMKVIICEVPGRKYKDSKLKRVSLREGLKQADFFTIHTPLSDLTKGLIPLKLIRTMKPGAYLINMARGGIVVEKDLAQALKKKIIAGAAADVLSCEPPPKNHPLLNTPNILLTPHMAWASLEARQRLVQEIYKNIESFLRGRKRNRVV